MKNLNFNLKDKVILVTGANGQLGLSLVKHLINGKAKVIATDRKLENIKFLVKKEKWDKSNIFLIKCDLTKEKDIKKLFYNGISFFRQIDSLVCNAGIATFAPFLERKKTDIEKVVNVNITGLIICIKEFIKHRKKIKKPSEIVNIGSHYGIISPDPRIYGDTKRASSEVYGASKAAIIQITKYYAVHAAEFGIRTNSVSPGGINDKDNVIMKKPLQEEKQKRKFIKSYSYRCPLKRLAFTDEVVYPILFLLSSASSYINGHNIVVDGGYTSW